MTLLEELQSLDLSEIVKARGSIKASVEAPGLQAILSGGAAQTALGELGPAIATLRAALDEPAALVRPLVDGIAGLSGHLNIDAAQLEQYVEATRDGAAIVAQLVDSIGGDPLEFGRSAGLSVGQAFEYASSAASGYAEVAVGELGRMRHLVDVVERGVPTEPGAFADLAIDILLPFPRASLRELRAGLTGILDGATAIRLPAGRTSGLVLALDAVAAAAAAGDAAAIERSTAALIQARANTIASLQNDLLGVIEQIGRLRLDAALQPLATAARAIDLDDDGIMEFLARFRATIAHGMQLLDEIDPIQAADFMPQMLDFVEAHVRSRFVDAVDAQVEALRAWLRDLFGELPLRALRAQLRDSLHAAARAIQDADLDRFARQAREQLAPIRAALESADLGAAMRSKLQAAAQQITGALDSILAAVNTIKAQIEALAGQAEAILDRGAQALATFKVQLDQITAAVEGIDIEGAAQQVIDTLATLRARGEELLSAQPLPEPMRPLVEQLIEQVRAIDLDKLIVEPVHKATAELKIPPEVKAPLSEGLKRMQAALENLIPDQLIESITTEIGQALEVLRAFDPATLVGRAAGVVNEAAQFLEGLDLQQLAAQIRAPFQTVLELVDAIHPDRLLKPVFAIYDSLVGALALPGPRVAAERAAGTLESGGAAISRAVLSPVSQLAPSGAVSTAGPGASAPPALGGVQPGDIIRMLGFLPARLRAALADLEAGPAEAALAALHALTSGLAAGIRGLVDALAQVEARIRSGIAGLLEPVGHAQLRASLALEAHAEAGTLRVDVSLDAVAQASPGRLFVDLEESIERACARARSLVTGVAGGAGAALDRVAELLERSTLAPLTSSLDALLAALDPEPLAAEFEAFVMAILRKVSGVLPQIESQIRAFAGRMLALIHELNPGTQALKFLSVLDVLREELDVLNPRRLAADLAVVHAAIRDTIAAYDPSAFVAEIEAILADVAARLRALDPAALLGDLSFLDAIKTRIQSVVPGQALAGVGDSLKSVGEQLTALDPAALLASVEGLGPRVDEAFVAVAEQIKQEIIALLESLKFASANASVSVSASLEVG